MMADHDLEVDFRGNVIDKSSLTMALTRADIERVLEHEAWSEGRLLDETKLGALLSFGAFFIGLAAARLLKVERVR